MKNKISLDSLLRLTFATLIFSCSILLSNAQKGSFLISSHSPASNNNLYFDLEISNQGNTYIASKNGIIKYNGDHHSIIDVGGAVLSLINSSENRIYAGGVGGFGFISENEYFEKYEPILSKNSVVIIDMVLTTEYLFALSEREIFRYNLESGKIDEFTDELAGQFHHIFEFNNQVLFTSENKGTLQIEKSQLVSTSESVLIDIEISFIQKAPDADKYIIATFTNELFIYEKGTLNPLLMDNDFLLNRISCANWYQNDQIVLGSMYGGIAIVNINDDKIIEEINFDSGLLANDVRTLSIDKNGDILSLSEKLIELIAINVPIKSFSHFEGLEGAPQAVAYLNNTLFVSTDRGLFSLNKINNYEERKYVVPSIPTSRSSLVETKSKKKRFRKKRKNNTDELAPTNPEHLRQRVITENIITSSFFKFEKIGETHHGSQLISMDSTLIVSGLSGVFEIKNGEVVTITSSPSFYSYLSSNRSTIFICGDNEIHTFVKRNDGWIEKEILSDFSDDISHILEFENNFWLCGTDKIHKIKIEHFEINDVEIYPFHNPYFDAIYGAIKNDSMHFFSSNNHYYFDNDSLVREIQYTPHQLTVDNNNNVWQNTNGVWQTPDNKHVNELFSTVTDIKHIYTDNINPFFWVLSKSQDILRFSTDQPTIHSKYLPYIDAIKGSQPKYVSSLKFSIEQLNNQLYFSVVHPDLTNLQNTLYRYRLQGLNSSWSEWSTNNEIKYSFLPAGNYALEIESKSALNQLHNLNPIQFTVVPPYWKQPLFYLFEFMVIVFLMMVSMKMRSLGSKFKFISRVLAFFVLAVILEGIEVIMESNFDLQSSPIFSFALQVITALILFPFEGFLRKYILLEKPSLLKKVLKK